MAITGLFAQELVHVARSAFGADGGTASATSRAERAAAMGIFRKDGITGDAWGMSLIGNCSLFV